MAEVTLAQPIAVSAGKLSKDATEAAAVGLEEGMGADWEAGERPHPLSAVGAEALDGTEAEPLWSQQAQELKESGRFRSERGPQVHILKSQKYTFSKVRALVCFPCKVPVADF